MSNEELVDRIQHGINKAEYMEQLYIQNRGFIFNVVKKYRYACQSGYNGIAIIEMDELMHEAYFGLVIAAKRYNPAQGSSFLTYAEHWIRQAVKRFLENSGQVIRVSVHTQEKIYKYNQVTAYFLNRYDREPSIEEYASYIGISITGVKKLEQYMFRGAIASLDASIPGSDTDDMTLIEAIPADINIEEDAVEKLAAEQLREELWDIVAQVLKDKKKIQIFRMRYINNMTMEQIGEQLNVSRSAIDQAIQYGIKMLRRNSRTKNLGEELGIWSREIPLDAKRVKRWARDEKLRNWLKGNDLKYAINMGWVDSGMM